jgi:hypothetical protein
MYVQAFAEVWPEEIFVQQAVAQIPWGIGVAEFLNNRPPWIPTEKGVNCRALSNFMAPFSTAGNRSFTMSEVG